MYFGMLFLGILPEIISGNSGFSFEKGCNFQHKIFSPFQNIAHQCDANNLGMSAISCSAFSRSTKSRNSRTCAMWSRRSSGV